MNPNDVYKTKPTSIPDSTWDKIGEFVRKTITDFINTADTNLTRRRSEDIRNAITKHIKYCYEIGYGLDYTVIFDDEIIQQSVATNTDLTTGTQGAIRSRLTLVGETLNPNFEGKRRYHSYARSKTTQPYTANEQQRIWQWANARLRTEERLTMKQVIVACGLGGGLKHGEAANLKVRDVFLDTGGACLHVGERIIPVAADWDEGLRQRLKTNPHPDEYLLYPNMQRRDKIMNRFAAEKPNAASLVPNFEKMRVTWIAEHIKHFVPDTAIANAAGVKSLRNYERFRPTNQPLEQFRGLMHRAETKQADLVVVK